MCDGEIELSDRAKSLWGKTNRVDDTEWLPLYVHMADSAAMAARIWDTWVPYGTKSIISRDLGNDDDLARKLMIFLAGVHDIGKATPVLQFSDSRGSVFQRWGRDYYSKFPSAQSGQKADK